MIVACNVNLGNVYFGVYLLGVPVSLPKLVLNDEENLRFLWCIVTKNVRNREKLTPLVLEGTKNVGKRTKYGQLDENFQ